MWLTCCFLHWTIATVGGIPSFHTHMRYGSTLPIIPDLVHDSPPFVGIYVRLPYCSMYQGDINIDLNCGNYLFMWMDMTPKIEWPKLFCSQGLCQFLTKLISANPKLSSWKGHPEMSSSSRGRGYSGEKPQNLKSETPHLVDIYIYISIYIYMYLIYIYISYIYISYIYILYIYISYIYISYIYIYYIYISYIYIYLIYIYYIYISYIYI